MLSNRRFQFKQFAIDQGDSVFKVNTDGVLLGAWANINQCDKILEIGSGTGFIALMMRQRNPIGTIVSVEIQSAAHELCKHNQAINSALFKDIQFVCCDIKNYPLEMKFDAIVSNPPFYEGSSISNTEVEAYAKHDMGLKVQDLAFQVANRLSENGNFYIIYPYERMEVLMREMQSVQLYCGRITKVKPSNSKPFHRVLMQFSTQAIEEIQMDEITILDGSNYTAEYIQLTRDFYLHF